MAINTQQMITPTGSIRDLPQGYSPEFPQFRLTFEYHNTDCASKSTYESTQDANTDILNEVRNDTTFITNRTTFMINTT